MIQKTTDYKKFKVLDANRSINMSHLAKLTISIAKRNMLEFNPIIVNENYEVIDGQHRLEVAKANKLPIFFIVVPNAGIAEVLDLNTNVRTWKLADYVDSLIVQGNRQIQFLKEFTQEYEISYTAALILLTGVKSGSKGNVATVLSKMEFPEEIREIGRKGADLLSVIRRYNANKGAMAHALFKVCRELVLDKKDQVVAKEIMRRGKIVASTTELPEMRKILNSYYLSVA